MNRVFLLGSVLIAVWVTGVSATETKIEMKDLPLAVQKAARDQAKGATLRGLIKETESGKTFYEVETVMNGRSRDVLLDASGHLVEVEEELTIDAVPAAVTKTLAARGKVIKVESVTRGKTVTYEAQVEKNGKTSEVAVAADGTIVR